ncbi:MAG: geranylgeranyl reductase family protein [Thermosphaera sp.]
MKKYDLIVAGAGPAGASATIKSAEEGYNTLLVEKGSVQACKPCGGVLTEVCVDVLAHELGLSLPKSVLSTPGKLGLFYVSPSGYRGRVKSYRLVNIERHAFDKWLRREAESRGVELLYGARLVDIKQHGGEVTVAVKLGGRVERIEARFLVGADGVFSKARRTLFPGAHFKTASVVQEHWKGDGELEECFYMLLLGRNITPLYGYLIPKGDFFIVGSGASTLREAKSSIGKVKEVLEGLGFKLRRLLRREHWFIPQGTVLHGQGNVLLVGDAGGFCNPFSGEGIRFAVETGTAAARALEHEDNPLERYVDDVDGITLLVKSLSQLTNKLDDEKREAFVRRELRRIL